jgi:hypothetical protein
METPNVNTAPNASSSVGSDVLHIPATSKLSPEAIAKALAHHNRHHHEEAPAANAKPGKRTK